MTDEKARPEHMTVVLIHTLRYTGQDATVPGDHLWIKTSQLGNNVARGLQGMDAALTVQSHFLEAAVEELLIVGIYRFDLFDFRVPIHSPKTQGMKRAPAEGSQEAFFEPRASDAKRHPGGSARLTHNQPRRIGLT
jgi:hypothetical protein